MSVRALNIIAWLTYKPLLWLVYVRGGEGGGDLNTCNFPRDEVRERNVGWADRAAKPRRTSARREARKARSYKCGVSDSLQWARKIKRLVPTHLCAQKMRVFARTLEEEWDRACALALARGVGRQIWVLLLASLGLCLATLQCCT